jgi:hypothetical protein
MQIVVGHVACMAFHALRCGAQLFMVECCQPNRTGYSMSKGIEQQSRKEHEQKRFHRLGGQGFSESPLSASSDPPDHAASSFSAFQNI